MGLCQDFQYSGTGSPAAVTCPFSKRCWEQLNKCTHHLFILREG